ncbi:uncharacterized protein LOC105704105 isoform X2 [Orussus abietinus]|uniref:uncharacterized protein LOC105704105 isoform X2 n=1 Tax=Orussus abietinus TaxID=222816 RepID=UPI000626C3A3|nr:uncharacterized protein LOC105704105 isoform X2 [Orussus abietinus]
MYHKVIRTYQRKKPGKQECSTLKHNPVTPVLNPININPIKGKESDGSKVENGNHDHTLDYDPFDTTFDRLIKEIKAAPLPITESSNQSWYDSSSNDLTEDDSSRNINPKRYNKVNGVFSCDQQPTVLQEFSFNIIKKERKQRKVNITKENVKSEGKDTIVPKLTRAKRKCIPVVLNDCDDSSIHPPCLTKKRVLKKKKYFTAKLQKTESCDNLHMHSEVSDYIADNVKKNDVISDANTKNKVTSKKKNIKATSKGKRNGVRNKTKKQQIENNSVTNDILINNPEIITDCKSQFCVEPQLLLDKSKPSRSDEVDLFCQNDIKLKETKTVDPNVCDPSVMCSTPFSRHKNLSALFSLSPITPIDKTKIQISTLCPENKNDVKCSTFKNTDSYCSVIANHSLRRTPTDLIQPLDFPNTLESKIINEIPISVKQNSDPKLKNTQNFHKTSDNYEVSKIDQVSISSSPQINGLIDLSDKPKPSNCNLNKKKNVPTLSSQISHINMQSAAVNDITSEELKQQEKNLLRISADSGRSVSMFSYVESKFDNHKLGSPEKPEETKLQEQSLQIQQINTPDILHPPMSDISQELLTHESMEPNYRLRNDTTQFSVNNNTSGYDCKDLMMKGIKEASNSKTSERKGDLSDEVAILSEKESSVQLTEPVTASNKETEISIDKSRIQQVSTTEEFDDLNDVTHDICSETSLSINNTQNSNIQTDANSQDMHSQNVQSQISEIENIDHNTSTEISLQTEESQNVEKQADGISYEADVSLQKDKTQNHESDINYKETPRSLNPYVSLSRLKNRNKVTEFNESSRSCRICTDIDTTANKINISAKLSIKEPYVLLTCLNEQSDAVHLPTITYRRPKRGARRKTELTLISESVIEEKINPTEINEPTREKYSRSSKSGKKVNFADISTNTVPHCDAVDSVNTVSNSSSDKLLFLAPGKSWARSLSILNRVHNKDDIEAQSRGKGKKWRESVLSILEMQRQGAIQSCIKPNEDDKDSRSLYKVLDKSQCTRYSKEHTNFYSTSPGRFVRRISVRVVPDSKLDHIKDPPFLEAYGISPINSEKRESSTILSPAISLYKNSFVDVDCNNVSNKSNEKGTIYTAKEVVLQRCNQDDYLPFSQCFPDSFLEQCRKIGEGVYGEVFLHDDGEKKSVIKIIPIEGTKLVNGSCMILGSTMSVIPVDLLK